MSLYAIGTLFVQVTLGMAAFIMQAHTAEVNPKHRRGKFNRPSFPLVP